MIQFAPFSVPRHAHPVIEGLHGKMNILRNFQLQHCQAAVPANGQQIDCIAVGGGRREDLAVDRSFH